MVEKRVKLGVPSAGTLRRKGLTSRFEVTRGLFWDGFHNFEPRSDSAPLSSIPSPKFRTTPAGGLLTHDLTCNRHNIRRIFIRIGFRHWKPFGSEADTFPLGHRGPQVYLNIY
ncbi:hypothetical protein AVEN_108828-1 [Araneus ventricosus]|uniref:Uncharacterized protein n=1 Tax=Araneus ventricosus TaxID=182803 RepID=A0A4Y2CEQ4_ARAVE|nr:hypothetical protein AVEN_108828-1 [Araneus ventricosus]